MIDIGASILEAELVQPEGLAQVPEEGRDPLAAADAHRNQAVTPGGTVQFMDGLGADNRTSCTDRMSQ